MRLHATRIADSSTQWECRVRSTRIQGALGEAANLERTVQALKETASPVGGNGNSLNCVIFCSRQSELTRPKNREIAQFRSLSEKRISERRINNLQAETFS